MGAVCAARAAASSNGFISGQGAVVGSSNPQGESVEDPELLERHGHVPRGLNASRYGCNVTRAQFERRTILDLDTRGTLATWMNSRVGSVH